MPNVPQTCFVIMPFSQTQGTHTEEYWTKHYDNFLAPLINEGGRLAARRSKPLRGDLVKEIVSDLVTAAVVVADLTDANPNVCWELGVRQSFRHGTVTIAQDGTTLPFDIGRKGTLFYYPSDHIRNEEFRTSFKAALCNCLDQPEQTDSEILDSLSGRGTLYEMVRRDEALRRIDALSAELAENLSQLSAISQLLAENVEHRRAAAQSGEEPKPPFRVHVASVRKSCCELLVSTRFLDLDPTTYALAESVLVANTAINNQLAAWDHKRDPMKTEDWLSNKIPSQRGELERLHSALVGARETLKNRP